MSDSKIVKAPFVSMSDIRKEIQTIDPNDPKILGNGNRVEAEPGSGINDREVQITEEMNDNEAISDTVIDGSHTILLEEAKVEVERLLEEAQLEAETIREVARQEGYDLGFQEGQQSSSKMLEEKVAELEHQGRDLVEQFEAEKVAYMQAVEPQIAYIIRDLVHGMIGKYEDDPSLILFLIKLAFEEVHTYGSFVIKVSDEDFDYVMSNKEDLTKGLSEKVEVEILKDVSMVKNQCFIETEMGNIDCSLNLRLESLSKELKLIGDSLK